MRTQLLVLFAAIGLILDQANARTVQDLSIATIGKGVAMGSTYRGGSVFFDIPYARPPLGDLRWRPPVPATIWDGKRDATKRGHACSQPDQGWNAEDASRQSEDCLYLNVWRPAGRGSFPVMVWYHGGAFVGGSGNTPLYDGKAFARHGVILVTVNYRLGVLGFLSHPDLAAENAQSISGNYGLLDQIEALRWVRRHIHAFGGDPAKITVFGQSAGSASVGYLLATPGAKGLIARAIAQSGTPFGIMAGRYRDMAAAQQANSAFGDIRTLRTMSAAEVLRRWSAFSGSKRDTISLSPVVDGHILPATPVTLLTHRGLGQTRIITGYNSRELPSDLAGEALAKAAREAFGAQADDALKAYGVQTDTATFGREGDQFMRDVMFGCGSQELARVATVSWSYSFRQPSPGNSEVRHSSELSYVFGNAGKDGGVLTSRPFDREEQQLSDLMIAYWTNFAKNGNPNRKGLPHWPAYNSAKPATLSFAHGAAEATGATLAYCDALVRQWHHGTNGN